MPKVTINDIARAANVSKSTVSRVLNNSAPVHPDKKKAVLEAVEKLGFTPNVVATSLARGRSLTIGVLTQLIGSPFYDAIAQGVIAGLENTGYSPILADGQLESQKEKEAVSALRRRRIDGLLLIGGGLSAQEIVELSGDVPHIVLARNFLDLDVPCICVDNVDGGYAATRYLIDRGHRRIALIKGHSHHSDAAEREQGYATALREAGIPLDPQLVVDGDFSPEAGVRAVDHLESRGVGYSAIFAMNDMMAFGARLALYRRRKAVPDEVSLVGFDDQMEAAFMTPPLTTIHQPARELGWQAARGIVDLIDGKPFSSQRLKGDLVERESVKPLNGV